MNATQNPIDDGDIHSPRKAVRGNNSTDAPSELPKLRTDRPRPPPAQRKISGSGARSSGTTDEGNADDVFTGQPTVGISHEFALVTRTARTNDGLVTGHHETDVESDLEPGEITENPPTNGPDANPQSAENATDGTDAHSDMAVDEAHPVDEILAAGVQADAQERLELGDPHPFVFANNAQADQHGVALAATANDHPDHPPPATAQAAPAGIVQGVPLAPAQAEERLELGHPHPFVFANPAQADEHGVALAAAANNPAVFPPVPAHYQMAQAAPIFYFGAPAATQAAPQVGNAHKANVPTNDAARANGLAQRLAAHPVLNGQPVELFMFPPIATHAAQELKNRYANPHRRLPAAPLPESAEPRRYNPTSAPSSTS
ncbi:hypothetical protein MVEN_00025600 [Mycena venus]|uniref:Uncharacterized protein n=1 Tax=Mycena venus TaxID=2733690 RepID=A0A8H6Z3L6_9AGAR|nr:hypothetical protein MVEN_00025600 [Mycena venus]